MQHIACGMLINMFSQYVFVMLLNVRCDVALHIFETLQLITIDYALIYELGRVLHHINHVGYIGQLACTQN